MLWAPPERKKREGYFFSPSPPQEKEQQPRVFCFLFHTPRGEECLSPEQINHGSRAARITDAVDERTTHYPLGVLYMMSPPPWSFYKRREKCCFLRRGVLPRQKNVLLKKTGVTNNPLLNSSGGFSPKEPQKGALSAGIIYMRAPRIIFKKPLGGGNPPLERLGEIFKTPWGPTLWEGPILWTNIGFQPG